MISNKIYFSFLTGLTAISFLSCKKDSTTEVRPFRQDIQEWVFAPGQIEWDDMYNLTAQTDGILIGADGDIGDIVTKGQVFALVDNRSSIINTGTSRQQLEIAEENVSSKAPALLQLKENIRFAEDKYMQDKTQADRYERLFQSQSISRLEYENVGLAAKNSLASLEALKKQYDILMQQARQQKIVSKGQLKNNEIVKAYNKILVLNDGTIIKKLKNTGDFVRRGDVIATVANSKKIEIVLTIDENSIKKIQTGQPATIRLNTDKDKIYKGKVSEILSAFDANSQSFICKIKLDEFLPKEINIYATPLEGNILTGEKKNALLIPREYMGYGNSVLLSGQDKKTNIKTGIISTDFVEVISGLTENDILRPLKP
ncbi:MAG: HlyD family efflux transporter periplasmic adaptor subunit [Saprospiraceae bacterium]|nr:HlyD family efflux transporter periplasmic adaptor subunit [Saprospiraceae bacterium]MBK8817782.1 HlyD family efflux transporter periplasmic adaptor subunit [Saprospiraceae bacterium]MBK8854725.1 HlyD family efflux transporter periplasmic adaptor subunit [Saprospiraceae bacterium]